MISIRKYLDGPSAQTEEVAALRNRCSEADLHSLALEAYRSAVSEMGRCSVDACAATGPALESSLLEAVDGVARGDRAESLAASIQCVRKQLQAWGRSTGRHYLEKAGEVKAMLLAMAQAAESVGERDKRCAQRLQAVTTHLGRIATLDDITAMRGAIEKSAAELKNSIERMNEEGRATLNEMQAKVATFRVKLEEAEQAAACDALTRLRSRLSVEAQLEQRVAARSSFSVAMLDINNFKQVNDTYGHVFGDELLRQFAAELRSACRTVDVVGRWGGDEFIIVLDCGLIHAKTQLERVAKWVFGNYVVARVAGPVKLDVSASVGLAEFTPPESIAELLDRADAAMYAEKRSMASRVLTR